MKCAHTHDSGPYVLGALLAADREAYERHLASCPSCRDDVADLAVLPGLLGRLDLATVVAMQTLDPADGGDPACSAEVVDLGETSGPETPLPGLLSSARRTRARQRRGQRWRMAVTAAVAATVAVVAVVVGERAVHSDPATTPMAMVLMQPMTQPAAVTGWVGLRPFAGGSRIQLRCGYTGGTDGVRWTFRLVVVPKRGPDEPVGSWTAGYGQEVSVTASTSVPVADIARIELRSGAGSPLLAYSP